jgi:exodeoxyribonuclease VII large subunit
MAESALSAPSGTLRVSQLTAYIKYLVEQDSVLSAVSVVGEIAELSRPASGHLYFSLKDASSQIACVMFRREALQQSGHALELKKGISVIVHGFLTFYETRGACQIYVQRVILQGEGAAARQLEGLKLKLEQEGLFAAERKRRLPKFPKKLALITSPGGQAYHDVLHRLRTHYPLATVIEAGVSVQGDGAADEIAMAIDLVNRLTDAEIILLVRGGGSPEDLAVFNNERLARAIFGSRIPIVTGIGHETDHSIADAVADLRAATPSLAAANCVPDAAGIVRQAAAYHLHCRQSIERRLRAERGRWNDGNRSLVRSSPIARLKERQRSARETHVRLDVAFVSHLRSRRARIVALRSELKALDPLAILSRGYAVLTDPQTGAVVSRRSEALPGQLLRARVSDGDFSVRVEAR